MQTKIDTPAGTNASGTTATRISVSEEHDVSNQNVLVMRWLILNVIAMFWPMDIAELGSLSWWRKLKVWFQTWFRLRKKDERVKLEQTRTMLLDHLWRGLPEDWPVSRVTKEWMPLPVYAIIERNLSEILGAPDRLFEAGFIGGFDSGFGAAWFKRIVLLFFFVLRFLMNVQLLYSTFVPKWIFNLYNHNKLLACTEERWNRVVLRTTYQLAKDTGEQLRTAIDDIFALLYWVPGMIATGARFWGLKPTIKHLLIEVDLIAFLDQVRPLIVEQIVVKEDYMLIEDVPFAIRTWFKEPVGSNFFTEMTAEPEGTLTRPGWRIIGDVIATTEPTKFHPEGVAWTVLRQGTYFCEEAGCSITAYELQVPWWYYPFFRAIGFLAGIFKPIIEAILGDSVKSAQENNHSQQKSQKYQSEAAIRANYSRLRYPNRDFQKIAEQGGVQKVLLGYPAAIMLDKVNSAKLAELVPDPYEYADYMQRWREIAQQVILPYDYNIRADDQVKVIWHDGTGDGAAISFVEGSSADRLNVALTVALQLHQRCGEVVGPDGEPFRFRIGIEQHGHLLMSTTTSCPCIVSADGMALNRAARWEAAGKDENVPKFDHPIILRRELAETVQDRWVFELLTEKYWAKGMTEPVALVCLIGPRLKEDEGE